ncbi:MAG TPA: hypothetical protein VH186_22040 [Chloroflexia bacterium]|nr:hypothetical protein [Chloroflexia bacterium]
MFELAENRDRFRVYRYCRQPEDLETYLTNLRVVLVSDWLCRALIKEGYNVSLDRNVTEENAEEQLNLIPYKELASSPLAGEYDAVVTAVAHSAGGFAGEEEVKPGSARYWLRCETLSVKEPVKVKFSGFDAMLSELNEYGCEPLAFRYFLTTAHYRNRLNFSLESLKLAQLTLIRLRARLIDLFQLSKLSALELGRVFSGEEAVRDEYNRRFWEHVHNNLALPSAISTLWQMLKLPYAKLHPLTRLNLLLEWDQVLGFGLQSYLETGLWWSIRDGAHGDLSRLSPEVKGLVQEYISCDSDYQRADRIIEELKAQRFKLYGGRFLLVARQESRRK